MRLGQIIGRVTLSQQDEAYHGGRFLIAHPLNREQMAGKSPLATLHSASSLVVYDNLGASKGDIIAFSEGAEATAPFSHPIPIDAVCCALIDRINYKPQQL